VETSWTEIAVLVVQIAMGISLAACAGLRAFLPLFVVGIFGRLGVVPLLDSFEWLASWPALIVFGVAVVTEVLADKVPVVDNLLDTVQLGVKPIAGVVLVASVLTDLEPLQAVVLGVVLGGPAAGAVHVLKAKTRLVSTAASAGIGNSVLSVSEDAGAVVGSVGAVFVPLLVLALLVAGAIVMAMLLRRIGARAAGIA
jgi:hypothetical protein